MSIRTLPSKWGPVALVCRKCGKKLGGGYGRKGKEALADTLHDALKGSGRRRALRVVEAGCLGLCPKGAVAIALSDRVLLVPAGETPDAVLAALLSGPSNPPGPPAPSAPDTAPAPPPAAAPPPARTD